MLFVTQDYWNWVVRIKMWLKLKNGDQSYNDFSRQIQDNHSKVLTSGARNVIKNEK